MATVRKVFPCLLIFISFILTACEPQAVLSGGVALQPTQAPTATQPLVTQIPTRPAYQPGELVDYTVQTGDTLPALAARFNTTEPKIRAANPVLPAQVTTLPVGMPMKIPIYYQSLWGSSYQILPDSLFVDGPDQVGFDITKFIGQQPGWLKDYHEYAFGGTRSASEIIDYIAISYSVSPRLLLALMDYQNGALTLPEEAPEFKDYPLGFIDYAHAGLYMQLNWAANFLNDKFYTYRLGKLTSFEHLDKTLERPDPWQNAATIAIQLYFASLYQTPEYQKASGPYGVARTYRDLFGDPLALKNDNIPGSLTQPILRLPYADEKTWVLTGGPHAGWGDEQPFAALDFAPPLNASGGCVPTDEWATAVADGTIVRVDDGVAVLDLDGDNDERTGWVIFYLHLANEGKAQLGQKLKAGDPIGHPSCEGGHATGTHVHIVRKYNGEWIQAGSGVLPFNLDGWVAADGAAPYLGTLTKAGKRVRACTCSDSASFVKAGE